MATKAPPLEDELEELLEELELDDDEELLLELEEELLELDELLLLEEELLELDEEELEDELLLELDEELLDDDELEELLLEEEEEPPASAANTASECTWRAVEDFHDMVTLPAAAAGCVAPAPARPDCRLKRCTMPAVLVRRLAPVEPTPTISITQAPADGAVTTVVMVLAEALLLEKAVGADA